MDILDYRNLMRGGIACQKNVRIEFHVGRYCRNEDLIILFVQCGVAHVEINFITYELKQNAAITIVPKSTIKCLDTTDDFRGSFLTYDREFGIETFPSPEPAYMDFVRNYPIGPIPENRVEATFAGIDNIVYFLYENKGKHHMQIVKNLVQAMLLELYDDIKSKFLADKPKVINRQNELFMQFIHMVYKYGDKQREVAFYADKLCITTRYLASIVRNIANETAKSIIDRHCVQEIKARLRNTNDSIQSMAIDMGFPDQSFFTRFFKKQTGMTPTKFRAMEML